ncbi:hypothetical protein GE09DRAFT_1218002 [Coniochaeta sp. 2T2.1]|nr:hypothetical protein GE09DRAFT_1218002 [Coniochaeta sp. 2T2.1]
MHRVNSPKKEKAQKLTLGEFIGGDSYGGSWADEVEDTYASGTQPLPPRQTGGSGYGSGYGGGNDRGYSSIRENLPQQIPDKPPYTLHLGNLSYEATQESVTEFFEGCNIVSVRIIEDREQQRPKGFAYAEFGDREGLVKALTLDGQSFQGRSIRVKVADPPKERRDGGFESRDLSNASWERKGPLAALPGSDRPGRSDFSERRAPREPMADDGKVRDFGNWERRGPLSPVAQPERIGGRSRDGSRPGTNDGFRNRHASPAWGPGEGRGEPLEPRLDGSRPPRREFSDRPERAPTAAEQDNQWRSHMRPDAPAKSETHSRAGSEAPSSPAGGAPATLAGGRPKLNLIKRTVSESPAVASPTSSDSKASPFGAARPIDTAAREREIEEKRLAAIKEKKEAEEAAKEERRIAKEAREAAAAKEAAEKAAAEEAAKEAAKNTPEEAPKEAAKETPAVVEATSEKPEEAKEPATEAAAASTPAAAQNGEQKVPLRTREPREPRAPREPREPRGPRDEEFKPQTRATESGNWRSASSDQRGGARGGAATRGPRGGGAPRGPRTDGGRPTRSNGAAPAPAAAAAAGEPETPKVDEDGWTTVAPPAKKRGGRTAI